jgi:O-antigen biosynthesis protein
MLIEPLVDEVPAGGRRGDEPSGPDRVAYWSPLPGGWVVLAGWCREWASPPPLHDLPRLTVLPLLFAQPEGADSAMGYLAALSPIGPLEPSSIDLGGHTVILDPRRAELVDVQSLAGLVFAGVNSALRADAASFLAGLQSFRAEARLGRALAIELRAFRDAVRVRPPSCNIEAGLSQGLFVDEVHRVDERSMYIRGWMRDASADITGLTVIAPEGARAELLAGLVRFKRADVEQFYGASPDEQVSARSGFLGYFELPAPSHLSDGWVVEMRNSAGVVKEAGAPPIIDDDAATRACVLRDLVHEPIGDETLVRDHAFPALSKLQDRRSRDCVIEVVTQFGTPPKDPDVTIIVPLYRRIDFLEHQLGHWVDDPDLTAADLIYVLDSPEQAAALQSYAAQLYRLYGVPFRTAVLRRNVGYALANNAGASLARGRLLLLLNSDVLPDAPGWLATMVDFLDHTPAAGAVGAKLLYEDESIQHGGMYFVRPEGSAWWENAHYFKGLHRSFPPANVARVVPAVTGACLLIPLQLWSRIGGLQGSYVQGDYEDSDLCLRLADLGYQAWYLPEAELYHLEGQSYETDLRRLTSRFNTWLHTHLWGGRITELMARAEEEPLIVRRN